MKKTIRYTLRIAGALLGIFLLLWLGLIGFILLKKQTLLEKARTEIKEHFGGDLQVGALDISFFRHFPSATLRLSDVSLRDSLWQKHHHDLLKASSIYVSMGPFKSLFSGKLQLSQIFVEKAALYFYTDSTGYSNTYLLRDRQPASPAKPVKASNGDLPDISLSDVRWVDEKQDKHKLLDFDVKSLKASLDRDGRAIRINASTEIHVNSFAFNTEKGSFLKDKDLAGRLTVVFNTASKIVQFDKVTIRIDGHPFELSGRFFPTISPDPFFLSVDTKDARFKDLSSLLTPNIQQKLDQYDIDKPVTVHAQLDAGSADDHTPQIQVRMNLEKASVLTPAGRFTNASFKASFTNEWKKGLKREDENSGIRLLGFSGELQSLPLQSDTLTITNLKHPQMACDLRSSFPIPLLNEVTGSETLQFQSGFCQMNLYYKGPLSENDTAGTTVNGHLDLDSAGVTYLPARLALTNANGRLLFKDQDLVIERLSAKTGSTRIQVKGIAKNLVALLDRNAENVSMDWQLTTPILDLEDFVGLTGPGSSTTKKTSKGLLNASFNRIDQLLKDVAVHVAFEADDLEYKKFSGAHAKANLIFDDHRIQLTKLTVQQGSGSLDLKATLLRKGRENPLELESHLDQVDLPKLFAAFNNFGQDALTSKNLKGRLTANIKLSGLLTDKVKIATGSMKGNVDFTITGGQLVDFEPMEKIHETVLKNRDLSDIRFAELQNQMDIDSTTLYLHRMEINSTAFTLFVEGYYNLKRGPDMSLQVPLSNLKKDWNPNIPPTSKGNDGKAGLSVRLRARRVDDGKLKVSWDPFRKALKKDKH